TAPAAGPWATPFLTVAFFGGRVPLFPGAPPGSPSHTKAAAATAATLRAEWIFTVRICLSLVSLRLHNRGRIAARGDRSSARNQFSCAVGPNAIVLRGRATNGAAVGAISRLRVALGSIIHCNTRRTVGP